MDPLLKELTKLEKLTTANAKVTSITRSLDSLLLLLQQAREAFLRGDCSKETIRILVQEVESKKKEVDDRQKEVYSALSRLGKALDKVPNASKPPHPLSCVSDNPLEISFPTTNIRRHILFAFFCDSSRAHYCSSSSANGPV